MKSLEGVVVPLSKVHKVKVGEKLFIMHCECLKEGLYNQEAFGPIPEVRDVYPENFKIKMCNECGFYPWHLTKNFKAAKVEDLL